MKDIRQEVTIFPSFMLSIVRLFDNMGYQEIQSYQFNPATHTHTHTHAHTDTHVRAHAHTHTCTRVRAHPHMHTRARTHMHTHIYIYIYTCVCVCVCVCMCVCVYFLTGMIGILSCQKYFCLNRRLNVNMVFTQNHFCNWRRDCFLFKFQCFSFGLLWFFRFI